MRRISLIFVFLLAACQLAPAVNHNVTAVYPTVTLSSSQGMPTLAPSVTPVLTFTPALPTALPSTPTFNISTVVTATSVAYPECPKTDNKIRLFLNDLFEDKNKPFYDVRQRMLEYLNAGGSISAALEKFPAFNITAFAIDVTNDRTPDLIVNSGYLTVFRCNQGVYETVFEIPPMEICTESTVCTNVYYSPVLLFVQDLNLNNIPELGYAQVLSEKEVSLNLSVKYSLAEWDGEKLLSLTKQDFTGYGPVIVENGNIIVQGFRRSSTSQINGSQIDGNWKIQDLDNDGLKDFLVIGGIDYDGIFWFFKDKGADGKSLATGKIVPGNPWDPGLQREQAVSFGWNGKNFVVKDVEAEKPIYRFQAVQDADLASLLGNFDKALGLYDSVINDDGLEWWSEARNKNEVDRFAGIGPFGYTQPTSPSLPRDSAEYPRLAAYAYYRMVLLHIFVGETQQAQVKYNTLQEKFPADDPGFPYAELGMAFWDTYQATGRMYDACAAAIVYADEHPEILLPLGSDYHGWQSHIYTPADICPLR